MRALADLERDLIAQSEANFRMLLVGEGRQREWLRRNLRYAELPGALHGASLANAFAGMDAFVFPSLTDTLGLVILLAASPHATLPPARGVSYTAPQPACKMGAAARTSACAMSWSGVFDDMHRMYLKGLDAQGTRSRMPVRRFAPAPVTDTPAAPAR